MAFLLYCICDAQAEVTPPAAGVRGAAIADVTLEGLRCFYSELDEVAADTAALQQEALEFHRVVHAIFQITAIIPFRFPVLVQDGSEITTFLASRGNDYTETLRRLRGAVQMEIRISQIAAPARADSGTRYLQAKAEMARTLLAAASTFESAARAYTLDWRQRTSRDGVHCYALVRREHVYNFEKSLQSLRLDAELKAVVSGPWPTTEFLSAKADEEKQAVQG